MNEAGASEKTMTVIGIETESTALRRKIELILGEEYAVSPKGGEGQDGDYDILVRPTDEGGKISSVAVIRGERIITLPYPFGFAEFRAAIVSLTSCGNASQRLKLLGDGRHVLLDGARIRLTESEYKLLSLITAGEGELVGRDELCEGVFGKGAESGILNVYVHYLREKLEVGGERIILSSRRGGYRIDKKYLGGE